MERPRLVIFGAGKIGRSFIGQLFARSGYEVVFIDINTGLIEELNARKSYRVVIKSEGPDETILIENVRGVHAADRASVIHEIITCDIAAISVGQKGLGSVIPLLAEGLEERQKARRRPALDIIIAENMRDADVFIRKELKKHLDPEYPIEEKIGLVETSIGKMVPVMPEEVIKEDPLLVYAEPYNTLILDRQAFKNQIPSVEGLAPKDNMKAWVDRKSYIHNLGHAACAYAGFLYNPDNTYVYEALADEAVRSFVSKVMQQSAVILMKKYPTEFTKEALLDHINDLLHRFENRSLKDTIYRVGCDQKRKLHSNDRILSPLLDGLRMGLPVDYILMVYVFGLCFDATDENHNRLPDDITFSAFLQEKGIASTISDISELNIRKVLDSIMQVP